MSRYCVLVLLLAAVPARAQDMPLSQVLLPGEGWRPGPVEHKGLAALAGDGRGNVYVSEPQSKQVLRIGPDGKAIAFANTEYPVTALAVGPEGQVYAAEASRGRIVRLDGTDKETVLTTGLVAQGIAVGRDGRCYASVPEEQAVYLIEPDGKKRVADRGIAEPSGLTFWPDGGTLLVADAAGSHLWTCRVERDGSLSAKERYYALRVRPKQPSRAGSLTVDQAGRAYAACPEGIQVFDPTGRMSGVLLNPERARTTAVAFGGEKLDRLYTICGGKLFVRKTLAHGVAAKK
jgi:gluconolactonase